uniref:DUF3453 domain-containing protein n=1 Tax=Steinernema glaseri TaxID=37863 RepID=A0A1I8ASZ6_9BILA
MAEIATAISALVSNTADLPMHTKCVGLVNMEHQFKQMTVDKVIETLHNFMLALQRQNCEANSDPIVDIIQKLTQKGNICEFNHIQHEQAWVCSALHLCNVFCCLLEEVRFHEFELLMSIWFFGQRTNQFDGVIVNYMIAQKPRLLRKFRVKK